MRCSRAVVAFVALLLLGAGGCGSRPTQERRVLLIGIDGAAPELIRKWIDQRLLPNLAGIARSGVSGPLRSHFPLLSPRIWTSIATGKQPRKHGIEGWVHKDESGAVHIYTSADRRVHALWNIASDHGIRVGVVNWLITHPLERITGVMISDFALPGEREDRRRFLEAVAREGLKQELSATPDGDLSVTYPTHWEQVVATLAGEARPLLPIDDPFQANEELPPIARNPVMHRSFHNDDLLTRIALEVDRQARPQILMILLQGIDHVSHFLWGGLEPPESYPERLRFSAAEREAAAAAIRDYYIYTDALIGKLLERFEARDLVMVVSDHGFEAVSYEFAAVTGGHDTEKALHGVILARGEGITPGTQAKDVAVDDITPTILAWLGLPVAEDMDGRVASFVDVEPVPPIPTYDTTPIVRLGRVSEDVEQSVLEDLRALGYIE